VGQVSPNTLRAADFYGDEFYWRQNYVRRIWTNASAPQITDAEDDPAAYWQDGTPSDTAKIYFVDSPASPHPAALGDIRARRNSYDVWCTFKYHDEPMGCGCADTNDCTHIPGRADPGTSGYRACSVANKTYYLRVTLRDTGTPATTNDKRDNESCANSNVFGKATQNLNYGLKAPTVTGIAPNSGQRGTTVTITNLAGTVFVKTPTVELIKGADKITATDLVVKSKNKIECKFAIPANAATGDWNVKVTNPAVDDDADGNNEAARSSNTDKTLEVTQ